MAASASSLMKPLPYLALRPVQSSILGKESKHFISGSLGVIEEAPLVSPLDSWAVNLGCGRNSTTKSEHIVPEDTLKPLAPKPTRYHQLAGTIIGYSKKIILTYWVSDFSMLESVARSVNFLSTDPLLCTSFAVNEFPGQKQWCGDPIMENRTFFKALWT